MLDDFLEEFPPGKAQEKIGPQELTRMLVWLTRKGVRPFFDFGLEVSGKHLIGCDVHLLKTDRPAELDAPRAEQHHHCSS
jgi:hypothetical protein